MDSELRPRRKPGERLLSFVIIAAAALVMGLFLYTALRRMRFPYELEELEGYVFLTSLRAFHGLTIYPAPSAGFMPYMYPPLYYYAAAAVGKIMGMSLATMRATSILSTLGCFAMIAATVRAETRRWLPAIAAAGLYAGCYVPSQEWFDLGRLDSLFILLVLIAIFASRWWHPVFAALAWTLAFQTKQSILPIAILVLLALPGWRRRLTGLSAFAVFAGGWFLWMQHVTGGWFRFFVFTVPTANSDIRLRPLLLFWPQEVLRPLGIALVIIVAAALLTPPRLRSSRLHLYTAAAALIPLFWIVFGHAGSTSNALMPVFAIVALLFGLAFARLLDALPQISSATAAQRAGLLLLAAVALQESTGIFDPADFRPNANQSAMPAVLAQLRALPGDVLVFQHPYYAWLAGKPTAADKVAFHDSLRPDRSGVRAALHDELSQQLDTHHYTAILLDDPNDLDALAEDAGETTWRGFYNCLLPIPGAESGTRPGFVLRHSDNPCHQ